MHHNITILLLTFLPEEAVLYWSLAERPWNRSHTTFTRELRRRNIFAAEYSFIHYARMPGNAILTANVLIAASRSIAYVFDAIDTDRRADFLLDSRFTLFKT